MTKKSLKDNFDTNDLHDEKLLQPKLIAWLIVITIISSIVVLKITSLKFFHQLFDFYDVGDFATATGSVTALIVGLIGSYLIYITVDKQILYNKKQLELTKRQIDLQTLQFNELKQEQENRQINETKLKEDFEREKERTRKQESKYQINNEINLFLDQINRFTYNNLQGAEAIYSVCIKEIRNQRHQIFASTKRNEIKYEILIDSSLHLLLAALEKQSIKVSHDKINEIIEGIKDISNEWKKTKDYIKILFDEQTTLKKISAISEVGMFYEEVNWEIIRELSTDLKKEIIDVKISDDFYHALEPDFSSKMDLYFEPAQNYIVHDFNYEEFDIDPKLFPAYQDSDSKLSKHWIDTFTSSSINIDHFYKLKIKYLIYRAEKIIDTINQSELSHLEKFNIQSDFENLFISHLSKELLYIPKYVDSIFDFNTHTLADKFSSNFQSYHRFVCSKLYTNSDNTSKIERSGFWLHNKFSGFYELNSYIYSDSTTLLCTEIESAYIFFNAIIYFSYLFGEKYLSLNEFGTVTIRSILFKNLPKKYSNQYNQHKLTIEESMVFLSTPKILSTLCKGDIKELMITLGVLMVNFENQSNCPFTKMSDIKNLDLEPTTTPQELLDILYKKKV